MDYLNLIGADFINLNEFEINEPNHKELLRRNFKLVEGDIAAVEGSHELAEKIINNIPKGYTLAVHYCPIGSKDGTQLRNRYKRRAESVKRPFEEITEDGTLLYLHVEGKKSDLNNLYKELRFKNKIPEYMMELQLDIKEQYLDLPWFLSEGHEFNYVIERNNLKAGIMEILPFRGKYFEMCEYTPLNSDHRIDLA